MKSAPLILAVFCATATASGPQFFPTGNAPGNVIESQMMGLSGNGEYAVGRTLLFGTGSVGTAWTASTGLFSLGQFGGVHGTIAYSASNDGVIVGVGAAASANEQAWRWTQSTGFQGLGYLQGTTKSRAYDITADGKTIVGVSGNQAYRWTDSTGMQSLGSASFLASSSAQAVSSNGLVIAGEGGGVGGALNAAWVWSDGEYTDLGHLGAGRYTRLFNLSADGSTAVGWSMNEDFKFEAYRWTADVGMMALGGFDPGTGFFESFATDASADGSIIVGSSRAVNDYRAFIWTESTGMLDLETYLTDKFGMNFDGWILQEAQGISDDGTVITGYGYNASGGREGWVVVIPTPSTLAMLTFGMLATTRRRR